MEELQTPVEDLQAPAEPTPLSFQLSVLLRAVRAEWDNGICVDYPGGGGGGYAGQTPTEVAAFILRHLRDRKSPKTPITLTHRLLDGREQINYAQVPDVMWKDIHEQLAALFKGTPWTLVESPVSA